MALDLYINPDTDDLGISSDLDLALVEGLDELVQHVTTELGTEQGTHVTNSAFGLPYRRFILVRNPSVSLIQGIIRSTLQARADITELEDLRLTGPDAARKLAVSFKAKTTQGLLDSTAEV